MSGRIIGIDLGTTNTVAAVVDASGPVVIVNEEGGRLTPSVVGYSGDDEQLVGGVAKRQLLLHPTRTIHSSKRLIGRTWREYQDDPLNLGYEVVEGRDGSASIRVEQRTLAPQEVSAAVLRYVQKAASAQIGEEITDAVITVPAYFNDRQRQATVDAGQIAGLNVVRVINEPTAAVLAYLAQADTSSRVAVFDFGGGTFDISVVEVAYGVAEVLSTAGNNRLGGVDLDQRLIAWLLEEFERENRCQIGDNPLVYQRLREAVERAKCELSSTSETEIHLPFLVADASGPKHLRATLTRARFETLVDDLLRSTIEECERALRDANLRPSDIDEVIMVGGSSRIPRIETLVKEFFGCRLNKRQNPDEVVAIGAAVQGDQLGSGGPSGGSKAVTLLDVTSFSLGIEVEGGAFAAVIPRNSTLPVQKSRTVSTVEDNQHTVKIHILQGEERMAADNTSLGDFLLTRIPRGRRGEARIHVTFAVDVNGMVQVTAREGRSGRERSIEVQRPAAMGARELSEAQDRLRQSEHVALVQENLVELRNDITAAMLGLEGLARKYRGRLREKDLYDLRQALERGRNALEKRNQEKQLRELLVYFERYEKALRDRIFHRQHTLD